MVYCRFSTIGVRATRRSTPYCEDAGQEHVFGGYAPRKYCGGFRNSELFAALNDNLEDERHEGLRSLLESRIFFAHNLGSRTVGTRIPGNGGTVREEGYRLYAQNGEVFKIKVTIPTEQMLFGAHVKQSFQNGSRRIPSRVPPASLLPAVQPPEPEREISGSVTRRGPTTSAPGGNIARMRPRLSPLESARFWLSEADVCAQSLP